MEKLVFSNTMSLAQMNKGIDNIAKRAAKLDTDVQHVGVSAIAHVIKCGDIGPINRLYKALGKGARHSALAAWLMAFAPVKPNDGPDRKEQPWSFAKGKEGNLERAIAEPWFEFKPEPEPLEMFNLTAALSAMLKRAATAAKVDNPELLKALKAAVASSGATVGKAADDKARKGAGATRVRKGSEVYGKDADDAVLAGALA